MDVSAAVALEGDHFARSRPASHPQRRTDTDVAPDGRRNHSALRRNVQLTRLASALCAIAHPTLSLSAACVSAASTHPCLVSGTGKYFAEHIAQRVDQHRLRALRGSGI